jgi:ferredoxin
VHLGVLPTERLRRDPGAAVTTAAQPGHRHFAGPHAVAGSIPEYRRLIAPLLSGAAAAAKAPIPDDPLQRQQHLKAAACFLDATLAGVCRLQPDESDLAVTVTEGCADAPPPTHALVFLIEFGREPAEGEPGDAWIRGCNAERTDLRCAEVAVVLAGYLRSLGWQARGHVQSDTALNLAALAQRAGVAKAVDGVLRMPFSQRGFRLGVVTTDMELACDEPIAADESLDWPDDAAQQGVGGTRPAFEDEALAQRPLHLGRWPMERIRRVAQPTTMIDRARIQRVPKRADLFTRALAGDLGPRAQKERTRFAVKHPLAFAMTPLIRGLVPLQGPREKLQPTGWGGDLSDPLRNAQSIKALGHFLGADFVGICEAEPWMWYSHDEVEGRPIEPYHRVAVVMLIDQGFETMEGASGDDWISGAQSMRAYLRGALIAGLMAAHVRRMGFGARAHSNAHSEVLHLPAVLMAGLGELSRIGELVLNPFIGPRSKSVVFTTDLPLAVDQPIDFGLQDTCAQCLKCARECPCNAIPYGPKTVFNGYEIWKPDVEKCGKYRLTNMKGSACGRCMKTCPFNSEDLVAYEQRLWQAIEDAGSPQGAGGARPRPPEGEEEDLGAARRLLESRRRFIEQDDRMGGGERNPVKRWWWDLEIVGGVVQAPVAGVNERDLSPGREDRLAAAQKIAVFPPHLQPRGGTTLATVVPLERAAGLRASQEAQPPQVQDPAALKPSPDRR